MIIYLYKLSKEYREFGFEYNKFMKTLEISMYFWNIIIVFGNKSI